MERNDTAAPMPTNAILRPTKMRAQIKRNQEKAESRESGIKRKWNQDKTKSKKKIKTKNK
ncbi:hypothetical protein [Methanimicrococcus hacksteinii]|uniref:hypothetical protein n=1 Tax=Methanimicrococcus hacksteinii TaxID=3028293 RepID=UPI00298F3116|nr:hypothetical protein [Methanimicrococcus sp. At1]